MKALVLAGGFPQIALLKELRKRNIYTVLADYYAEPVAKPYADKAYQVSTLDVDAITEVARREEVDFLITACTDQALLTVANVSEKLGLPCYIDYKTALNVTNKQYMKQVFEQNGVPTAKHIIMGKLDTSAIEHLRYPLIVKPVDCNSSKGVIKVASCDELQPAFDIAVNLSRTKTAVVEEYIEGEELTADIYVENGVAHVLSVASSVKIGDNDKFVIFRTVYSHPKHQRVTEKVRKIAQQIADAFGLVDSPMLIQMIYDGEEAYVLEFSARTGGAVKYLLIDRVSGFDVISAVVDLTMGIKPQVKTRKPESEFMVNDFIYCHPGVFDRLDGFEELKKEGIISDYYLFKWKGAVFDSVDNSGDRVAGFTVQGNTVKELQEKHRIAAQRIRVLDTDGNDMMRRDLLIEPSGF